MALNSYGHVFDELEDAESASAEELIREAGATPSTNVFATSMSAAVMIENTRITAYAAVGALIVSRQQR